MNKNVDYSSSNLSQVCTFISHLESKATCLGIFFFFNFLPDGTGVFTYIIVFLIQFIMRLNINTILSLKRRRSVKNISTAILQKLFLLALQLFQSAVNGTEAVKEKIFCILGCIENGISTNKAHWAEDKNKCRYFFFTVMSLSHLGWALFSWQQSSLGKHWVVPSMSFELQVPSIPACVPQCQTIEPSASHSQIVITSVPCRSSPIDS